MTVHAARMPAAVDDDGLRERAVPDRGEWRWGPVVRWSVVAVLAAAAIAAYAWRSESGRAPSVAAADVPLLKADGQPTRVRPESPGGMEIADRDKFIYRRLREGGEGKTIERLLPAPEEPKLPVSLPAQAPPVRPEATDPSPPRPVPDPHPHAPAVEGKGVATGEVMPEKRTPPVTPPKPAVAPAATASAAPTASGAQFIVQIGAVRTQQEVQAEWDRLRRSHGDLLGGLSMSVARADLGEKGVFYRLRAGPVDGEDKAKRLCSALAQRKVNCYPVRAGG